MTVTYPVLATAIVVNSTNNVFRVTEDATTASATITAGTYFLRGSSTDTASDNLLYAMKTALEAATGSGNTYTISLALSADSTAARVTFTRATGSHTFALLWANGSTTFPATLIGHTVADTANDANAKAGGDTPSLLWVGHEPLAFSDPGASNDTTITRFVGGQVQGFDRGGPYERRRLGFAYVDDEHTFYTDALAASDAYTAFETWWRSVNDGRRFEYHETSLSSGATLTNISTSTRIGTYHLDEASCREFEPTRLDPGLELYNWSIGLLGYVA